MKEIEESARPDATVSAQALIGPNPPWKAKTVWIAALLALIGAFFWVKDAAQKPAQSTTSTTPGMTSFADSTSGKDSHAVLKPTSPATFRLGVSYLGGFFLGWAFRRFLKGALLVSGAIILLIGLAKKLGWIDLDWASIEAHVRSSLAWFQGEAGTIRQFLFGYLPSAGAAGIGAFLGFRRR
ncbi:MAG: FUN14 domain-containing protein [Verrucomicrobia bacterium]|nr:FUN14 domain-containing protein [Verrucomicrobiota bacterium]